MTNSNRKAYLLTYRTLKDPREKFDSFVEEMKELSRSVELDIIETFEQW
jgi:hypothetical protein